MTRPVFRMALLAFASLVFGWETYRAWTGPVPTPVRPEPGRPPVSGDWEVPNAAAPAAPAPIASITARPLFRPDRRPFQENAAVAVPRRNYEAELNRFTVLGVVMMEGSEKAIVTGKTGGREERYEVGPGDALPGFTVVGIRADGVVVAADEREFILPLYAGAPKAAAGTPLRTEVPRPAVSFPPPAGQAGAPQQPRAGAAAPAQPPSLPGIGQPRSLPGVQPPAPQPSPRRGPPPSRRRPPLNYLPSGQ